jgi:hypothetical protein
MIRSAAPSLLYLEGVAHLIALFDFAEAVFVLLHREFWGGELGIFIFRAVQVRVILGKTFKYGE